MTEQLDENQSPCGCGRSPSGFCVGLHSLTEDEWQDYLQKQFEDNHNGS